MRYLKVFGLEWLEGSIRRDLDSSGRGIWADFLAMATISRRYGFIERSKGIPYTDEELAQRLKVDLIELRKVIDICILEGRLARDDTDTLYIVNWDRYQDYPLGSEAVTRKADKTKTDKYQYQTKGKVPDIDQKGQRL